MNSQSDSLLSTLNSLLSLSAKYRPVYRKVTDLSGFSVNPVTSKKLSRNITSYAIGTHVLNWQIDAFVLHIVLVTVLLMEFKMLRDFIGGAK